MKIHTPHITATNTSLIPDHARTVRKPHPSKGVRMKLVTMPPGSDPDLALNKIPNLLAYEPTVRVKPNGSQVRNVWVEENSHSAPETEQAALPEALIAITHRIEEADEAANRDKDAAEKKVSVARHFFPSAFGG